jgi:acyl carrier protein
MQKSEIEQFITSKLRDTFEINIESFDKSQTFEAYGIDSISAVRMVGELEDLMDMELSSTLLWEYNSIEKLTAYLSQLFAKQ